MRLKRAKKKNDGLFTTSDHTITFNHTHSLNNYDYDKVMYGQGYIGDNAKYPKYDFSYTGSIPSVDPNIAKIEKLEEELKVAKERIRELEQEVEEKVIVI